jgi:uncharacterized Zn-finger protein
MLCNRAPAWNRTRSFGFGGRSAAIASDADKNKNAPNILSGAFCHFLVNTVQLISCEIVNGNAEHPETWLALRTRGFPDCPIPINIS